MRKLETGLHANGIAFLLAAIACAAYIAYRIVIGQPSAIAWLPFVVTMAGALHYFRRARR